jgi:hypothetical protein
MWIVIHIPHSGSVHSTLLDTDLILIWISGVVQLKLQRAGYGSRTYHSNYPCDCRPAVAATNQVAVRPVPVPREGEHAASVYHIALANAKILQTRRVTTLASFPSSSDPA